MVPYTPLPIERVPASLSLFAPPRPRTRPLNVEDPATEALTDFQQVVMVTVRDQTPVDSALDQMIQVGVRFLFVVNSAHQLVGAITSYDILGEKPLRYMQSIDANLTSGSHAEVLVRHVMAPVSEWRVLDFERVRGARVGNVVATMQMLDRRHIVVTQRNEAGGKAARVRGLFSASDLERQLGMAIEASHAVASFASIEQAVIHGVLD